MMRHVKEPLVTLALLASFACTSTEIQGSAPNRSPTSPIVRTLAASDCLDYSCGGPLELGQYRADYFDPTIAFEIASPGWTWSYSGNFQMFAGDSSADGHSPDGINFFLEPSISSQDCEDAPAGPGAAEPGVGRSVSDLVEWLRAAPGLATNDPAPVTVGGLDGVRVDLQLDPAWKRKCFFSEGQPAVPLIFSGAEVGGYDWAIIPEMSMRWYILDSEDGVIIVDIEDNPGGLSRDDLYRTGGEIIDSLVFASPS
jgi:hypothetical protein